MAGRLRFRRGGHIMMKVGGLLLTGGGTAAAISMVVEKGGEMFFGACLIGVLFILPGVVLTFGKIGAVIAATAASSR